MLSREVCWLCVQKRLDHEHFVFTITENHREVRFCPLSETRTMALEELLNRGDDLAPEQFGSLPQFVAGQIAALQTVSGNFRRIGWYQPFED